MLLSRKSLVSTPPILAYRLPHRDALGAGAAGWEAASIKRLGNDVFAVGPQPQIVGDNLNGITGQLIGRYKEMFVSDHEAIIVAMSYIADSSIESYGILPGSIRCLSFRNQSHPRAIER
jgi:hypothetical protein